jgi:hypothetical protein
VFVFNQVEEYMLAECKLIGKRLKLAVLVFVAFGTIGPVFRKEKLNDMFPSIPHLQGICMNLHTFGNRHGTGCNECPGALLFHHAYTAITRNTKIGMIAEGWYVYIQLFGGIQYCCASRNRYYLIVYSQINHNSLFQIVINRLSLP